MVDAPRDQSPRIDLPALAALALWGSLGLLTLGALSRRGASGFATSEFGVILTVFVSLAASLGAWSLFHWSGGRGDMGRRMLDGLLSLVPPAVLGISLAAGSSAFSLCLIALFLAMGGAFLALSEVARLGLLDRGMLGTSRTESVFPGDASIPPGSPTESQVAGTCAADDPRSESVVDSGPEDDATHEAQWPQGLIQRVVRTQDESGSEHLEAVLLARFAAGEREVAIHLPIHPPLPSTPVCETEPLSEQQVDITVSTARPYGIRLEVRRSGEISRPIDISVGLQLMSAARAINAA